MKPYHAFLSMLLLSASAVRADIQTEWAYHAVGSGNRISEQVPGESQPFLANGTDQVNDGESITLFILTAQNFAGDMDEQIYVRWWDGTMSHWIMGSWVKNVALDAARPEAQFRGLPTEGTVGLDLWKVEIPAWITQPGENFYAIQLKGFAHDAAEEIYLLSKPGGDFTQTNNLGQVWSASEEFGGQDWMVNIWQ